MIKRDKMSAELIKKKQTNKQTFGYNPLICNEKNIKIDWLFDCPLTKWDTPSITHILYISYVYLQLLGKM